MRPLKFIKEPTKLVTEIVTLTISIPVNSYTMGTGGSFPGREDDSSTPFSAEAKWSYTAIPPYVINEQPYIFHDYIGPVYMPRPSVTMYSITGT
jgi:hypothetical protein